MIAIFDLDGTLALNEHRQHFLEETPKNWKAFNEACVDDNPNWPVIKLFDYMRYTGKAYIFSGRSNDVVEETVHWFNKHGIEGITRETLRMRESGDFRDDRIVKKEMFNDLLDDLSRNYVYDLTEDFIIFDDRQKVVDMWREMGLVCCQVAPGIFNN